MCRLPKIDYKTRSNCRSAYAYFTHLHEGNTTPRSRSRSILAAIFSLSLGEDFKVRTFSSTSSSRNRRSICRSRSSVTLNFSVSSLERKQALQGLSRNLISSDLPLSLMLREMAAFSFSNANCSSSANPGQRRRPTQMFDYFLVLDFEATSDNKNQPKPQEIIEFPVLKVNAKTYEVESVFHQYVLPQYHPHLTPFCTQLTGIIQDMVDGQPHLPEVLENFHKWMIAENLVEPLCKSIFVTCGDWDLKAMLPKQCAHLQLTPDKYFGKWINIKKAFADMTGNFPKGMMSMLQTMDIKHIGRHHSGIDDCRNIANILITMIQQGYVFKQTGSLG